jgi:hypothetical protein
MAGAGVGVSGSLCVSKIKRFLRGSSLSVGLALSRSPSSEDRCFRSASCSRNWPSLEKLVVICSLLLFRLSKTCRPL